ncbi:unnamed protein product [Amoebophrya sp. A120]|nr:unnamed protein product [Amoebophrya sp. A120]|eukprot:GSA120T00004534001.1
MRKNYLQKVGTRNSCLYLFIYYATRLLLCKVKVKAGTTIDGNVSKVIFILVCLSSSCDYATMQSGSWPDDRQKGLLGRIMSIQVLCSVVCPPRSCGQFQWPSDHLPDDSQVRRNYQSIKNVLDSNRNFNSKNNSHQSRGTVAI